MPREAAVSPMRYSLPRKPLAHLRWTARPLIKHQLHLRVGLTVLVVVLFTSSFDYPAQMAAELLARENYLMTIEAQ